MLNNVRLGFDECLEGTTEIAYMGSADHGEDHHIGLNYAAAPPQVAAAMHAELQHRCPVMGLDGAPVFPHVDAVIAVLARFIHPPALLEYRRCHFLGGGLAGTAGHRDHRSL